MGETNVTLPVRSMRRKAFGAKGALVVNVSRISARTGKLKASSRPPLADTLRKLRRFISCLRISDASSLLDGRANPRIGATAADVAGHGAVDVGVAGLGRCGEQRARRHDLPPIGSSRIAARRARAT